MSALQDLLKSSATKLSENVVDGEWSPSLFPTGSPDKILAGIIWRSLGSPKAEDRWRAAHSVRYIVKLDRIKALNELLLLFNSEDAGSFQAPELPFYYLHARLWLLIALARISIDTPQIVANYYQLLLEVLREKKYPHVAMKLFAAKALSECISQNVLKVSEEDRRIIEQTNISKYSKVKRTKKIWRGFYEGRPNNAPKRVNEFYLDYDFEKHEVSNLGFAFGLNTWEVSDRLSEIANNIDPKVKSMNDSGGRYKRSSSVGYGMVDEYHTYGEQLGWHSLQIVAGKLVEELPVVEDDFFQEPWLDWLNRYTLTLKSGLWLADGTDNTPLDVNVSLIEKKENGDGITGDESKIKGILRINDENKFEDIILDGRWKSPDGIEVNVQAALVDPNQVQVLARRLLKGDPFKSYLQTYMIDGNGNEYVYDREKRGYVPLIAHTSADEGIDKEDPYGTIRALTRPRFSKKIETNFSLSSDNVFAKKWLRSGFTVATVEAWKHNISLVKNKEDGGSRLICSASFLRDILVSEGKDLLVLINLQRYTEGFHTQSSSFSNTTAVVHIDSQLKMTYFNGATNKKKKNRL